MLVERIVGQGIPQRSRIQGDTTRSSRGLQTREIIIIMEFIYIALVQNAREENAAAFVYDVYDGFQKNERTLTVAFDPEDAYNRVLLNSADRPAGAMCSFA